MADIGSLVVRIQADGSQLERAFSQLGGSAQQFQKGLNSLSNILQTGFLAATSAAVALTIQAGKTAEEMDQLSQKTGIAASSLEGMSVMMARDGLSAQSMAMAVKGLSKEMVGVQQGTASSIKLFQDMGVSLDVVEKGTAATMRAIADRFKEMPDGAMKAKVAVELFGRAGLDLIPMLNRGGAAFEESMKKASEFGLVLNDTVRGQLTGFDDAMDDLQLAVQGFGTQVGIAFAPTLTILVKAMTDAVVFAKNVFNQFADAAEKLAIRFGAVVASIQLISNTLFSLNVLSKAAWEETANHVRAIDQWAASELKGVDAARAAQSSLGDLAMKQLEASQAAETHAASQQRLGEQIVSATKIQLKQAEALGKQQERMGADIVSGTKIGLNIEAQEGKRQEALGRRIQEEFAVSQQIAQDWIDAYQLEEDAATARFQAEMDAMDRNQEMQGRYIVNQAIAAQKVKGFWETQLDALVASNAFSVGQIVSTWTSGIANSIVNGGNFVKQAWQSTQVAIIQGGLNLVVQWGAQQALMVAQTAGTATATVGIWGGATAAISGFFAATSAAFTAMVANMVAVITAVGEFVMGVLAAIANALTATVFGIPWAGAIVAGIALIAAALAATGNLGFKEGGMGDFGSGTAATLHGPEAIIPLNERGATFLQEALGIGDASSEPITIQVPVMLDGRQIALATARHLPTSWRNAGAPA